MKNTIVAGSRGFNDYKKLDFYLNLYLPKEVTIICGMARGADLLGRRWAIENSKPYREYPADWDLHGKSAGFKRNVQMSEVADQLIAFWDGHSNGTKHMIDIMKKAGKEVIVV